MSEYTARANEVFAEVLQFVRRSSARPADSMAATAAADSSTEHAAFNQKTIEYFERRKQRFKELFEQMDPIRSGTENGMSRWRTPLDGLLSDRQSTLGAILGAIGTKPSQEALDLHWKIYEGELIFVEGLRDAPAAERWERMGKVRIQLMETTNNLNICWKDLLDKLRSIDEMQARLSSDVLDLVANTKRELGAKDVTTGERLYGAVSYLKSAKDYAAGKDSLDRAASEAETGFQQIDQALNLLADAVRVWRYFTATLAQNKSLLSAAQRAEIELHKIFWKIRNDTIYYLRDPPKERANYLLEESRQILSALASKFGSKSAGLAADMTDLGGALIQIADKTRVSVEELSKILDLHRGRFFDSLSGETLEALLRLSAWETRRSRIDQQDFVSSAKFLLERARRFCDVDLAAPYRDLTAALAARNFPETAQRRDDVVRQLGARWDNLQNQISRMKDEAGRAIQEAIDAAGNEELRELHQRRTIESQLRSGY